MNWKARGRAAGIHFCASLAMAILAAVLVFWLWYPYPYSEISGGRELFTIVVAVDVILGPLITLAIFNLNKPKRELRRDLAIVILVQLAGLGYGLWTVAVARPVHLVLEVDRFRVVHAVDVPESLMGRMREGVDAMPWTGPTLLAIRPFRNEQERIDATIAALKGLALGARPDLWTTYADGRNMLNAAAKPVAELKTRFPARAAEIDQLLTSVGRTPEQALWLPLVGRKSFWTAFVDSSTGNVVGYLPLDPY